jgi:hypothetical protein
MYKQYCQELLDGVWELWRDIFKARDPEHSFKKDQAADEFSGENNSRWGIETYKDTILLRCSRFVRWLLA